MQRIASKLPTIALAPAPKRARSALCPPWALLACVALLPRSAHAEEPFVFEPPPTLLPTPAQLRDLEDPPQRQRVLKPQTQPLLVSSSTPATLRVDGRVIGPTPQTVALPVTRKEVWRTDQGAIVGGVGALAGSVLLALGATFAFHVEEHGLFFAVPEHERDKGGVNLLGVALAVLSGLVAVGGMVALGLGRRRVVSTGPTDVTIAVRLVGESAWQQVRLRGTPPSTVPRLHYDAKRRRWQRQGKPAGWKLLQMRGGKGD